MRVDTTGIYAWECVGFQLQPDNMLKKLDPVDSYVSCSNVVNDMLLAYKLGIGRSSLQ